MAGAWGLPVGRHSHMKNRERKDSFLGFMQNDKNWWYLMSFIPKKMWRPIWHFLQWWFDEIWTKQIGPQSKSQYHTNPILFTSGEKMPGNQWRILEKSGLSLNMAWICIFDTWPWSQMHHRLKPIKQGHLSAFVPFKTDPHPCLICSPPVEFHDLKLEKEMRQLKMWSLEPWRGII